ncbi:sensor domain-containing protein [Nonomuraea sp. NPDC049141]|uniref:sensor histidine kinase n=1 Tax=unclassified Nonomuraea TaxID=2593643 RepID=UPI0033E72370
MSTHDPTADRRAARGWDAFAFARARAVLDALEHIVGGLGTAVLAFVALVLVIATALTCLIGVGLLLAPVTLRVVRVVADRERGRLSRWGPEVVGPAPMPHGLRAALADSAVRRELGWMAAHGIFGLLLGGVGISLPIYVVRDTFFPLYWWLLPPEEAATGAMGIWTVQGWSGAFAVTLLGLGWIILCGAVLPGMARLQAWPGRRLLAPVSGTDLALRVVQLTATRAAALDAHSAELRRIERSLHDGTQNRIVAVNVLLGAARRALTRDPASAEAILERAQDAAEQALAELRGVVRSILPPVLTDRSLADALTGLATACPVPCRIDADLPVRCASSVEATAYFVVAETLTNIAKHSQARHATVTARLDDDRLDLQITDDGQGGADERNGSGFVGIRRRTEAHDGTFMLNSPPGGPTTVTVSLPCGS